MVTQNLSYCAIFLFSYRKTSVVLYVPCQTIVDNFYAFMITDQPRFGALSLSKWRNDASITYEYHKRQGIY